MQTSVLRNAIMHAVGAYETQSGRYPQGRRRKLSLAYILDRIFYVCRTGCQWSQLHVQNSSYKTVFHYFNLWSKAHIFEDVFYDAVKRRVPLGGALAADTSFVKNVYGKDVTGRNPTDRGRKATKVSLLTDCRGAPRNSKGTETDT
jgi:putative transposase